MASKKEMKRELDELARENEKLKRQSEERVAKSGKAKRQKKKKHGCLRGCRNFIIFCFVLFTCVSLAGYFVGDYYSKQYLNLPAKNILSAVGSVVGGVAFPNENKLISEDERFSDADKDDFYANLKNQVFLSDSFDLEEKLLEYVEQALSDPSGEQVSTAAEGEEEPQNEDSGNMDEILSDLLKAENFNLSRLKDFDYDNPEPFTQYKLTDKQIAAFLNSVFVNESVRAAINSTLKEQTGMDIQANLSIKRIVFETRTTNYFDENGNGVDAQSNLLTADVTVLKLTIGLELRTLVKGVLNSYGYGWASFVAPKNFFLTAEIGLSHNTVPAFYINNISPAKTDNVYRVIESITGFLGEPVVVEDLLLEQIGKSVIFPMITSINSTFPLDQLSDRALTVSPFDLLIGMMAKDIEPDRRPEARDLFMMLKSLVDVPREQIVLQPYDSTYYAIDDEAPNGALATVATQSQLNAYVVSLSQEDLQDALDKGYLKYDSATDTYSFANHLDVFKNVLAEKYFVDLGDTDALLDFLGANGEGSGGDTLSSLQDKFNPQNFKESYQKDPTTAIGDFDPYKVYVTDFMLAAIAQETLSTRAGDGPVDMNNIKVEQIILDSRPDSVDETLQRQYLTLTVSLKISEFFKSEGETNAMTDFFEELIDDGQLSEYTYITVVMDVTYFEGEEGAQGASYIKFNALSQQMTDKAFDVLLTLAGLDIDDMIVQIDDMVKPMLDDLRDIMDIEFVDSAVQMPDVYDLIIELMNLQIVDEDNTTDPQEPVYRFLTAAELRTVLRAIDRGDALGEDATYLDNMPNENHADLNNFFLELEENYYLKSGILSFDIAIDANGAKTWLDAQGIEFEVDITDEDVIALYKEEKIAKSVDMLLGKDTSFTMHDFNATLFRLENDGALDGIYDDSRNSHELIVQLSDKALVEIVKTMLDSGESIPAEIVQISILEDTQNAGGYIIELTLKADVNSIFGTSESSDFDKFLPKNDKGEMIMYLKSTSRLSVELKDTDDKYYYETSVVINAMNANEQALLDALLNSVAEGSTDKIRDLEIIVGKALFDSFDNMQGTLGFEFGRNELVFVSFYDLLSDILGIDFETHYGLNEVDAETDAFLLTLRELYLQEIADTTTPANEVALDDPLFLEFLNKRFNQTLKDAIQGMKYDIQDADIILLPTPDSTVYDEVMDITAIDQLDSEDMTLDGQGGFTADVNDHISIGGTVSNQPSPTYALNSITMTDEAFAAYLANDDSEQDAKSPDNVSNAQTIEIMQLMVLPMKDLKEQLEAKSYSTTNIEDLIALLKTDKADTSDTVKANFADYALTLIAYVQNYCYGYEVVGESADTIYGDNNIFDYDLAVFTLEVKFDEDLNFEDAEGIMPESMLINIVLNLTLSKQMQQDADLANVGKNPSDEDYVEAGSSTIVFINGYNKEEQDVFFYLMEGKTDAGFSADDFADSLGNDVLFSRLKDAEFVCNMDWTASEDAQAVGKITFRGTYPTGILDKLEPPTNP